MYYWPLSGNNTKFEQVLILLIALIYNNNNLNFNNWHPILVKLNIDQWVDPCKIYNRICAQWEKVKIIINNFLTRHILRNVKYLRDSSIMSDACKYGNTWSILVCILYVHPKKVIFEVYKVYS